MKNLALILLAIFTLSASLIAKDKKKDTKTIVYKVNIHCDGCKKKIEENIPFEKGVKDLSVDMESHKVTVKIDAKKTDSLTVQKSLEKLDFIIEK